MKKARKLGLQSLALVLMAFVLVAGVAFGMTGAWFTSTGTTGDQTFTFGNIEITTGSTGAAMKTRTVNNTLAPLDGKLMPGDTIDVTVAVTNAGNQSMWYAAHVEVSISGTQNSADLANEDQISEYYVYSTTANDNAGGWVVATSSNLEVLGYANGSNSRTGVLPIELDGATYDDDYENAVITVKVTIYAIQAANIAMSDAFTMLTDHTSESAVVFESIA